MSDDADDLAVLDHLLEAGLDRLLAQIVGPLAAGLGERLPLALVPLVPYHHRQKRRETFLNRPSSKCKLDLERRMRIQNSPVHRATPALNWCGGSHNVFAQEVTLSTIAECIRRLEQQQQQW